MKRQEVLQIAKPILFNTQMVKAILEDRKTVTRRVIKPQPQMQLCYTFAGSDAGTWGYPGKDAHVYWGDEFKRPENLSEEESTRIWKTIGNADDILYVRETWQYIDFAGEHNGYVYKASENGNLWETETEGWTWKPSIHMPKEAARIFLRITSVHVERLQDMTEDDALKEGVDTGVLFTDDETLEIPALRCFQKLWNSTIKKSDMDKYGWNENPYVWVIEFERLEVEELDS